MGPSLFPEWTGAISAAQSSLYEPWLHLFPLARPWEFNFLVPPQAPSCLSPSCLHLSLSLWLSSASPHTGCFESGPLSSFLISSLIPGFSTRLQLIKSHGWRQDFRFTHSLTVQTVTGGFCCRASPSGAALSARGLGHWPPPFFLSLFFFSCSFISSCHYGCRVVS